VIARRQFITLLGGDRPGVRLMRRRRGARASSASIAPNSFFIARADGAPSVSFR